MLEIVLGALLGLGVGDTEREVVLWALAFSPNSLFMVFTPSPFFSPLFTVK